MPLEDHSIETLLKKEIYEQQLSMRTKINDWLFSLEGDFLSPELAKRRVESIREIVARAGFELLFHNSPVSLNVVVRKDQTHATIQLATLGRVPQRIEYTRVKFPLLSVRPVELRTLK
jgi:hypothetical protein